MKTFNNTALKKLGSLFDIGSNPSEAVVPTYINNLSSSRNYDSVKVKAPLLVTYQDM